MPRYLLLYQGPVSAQDQMANASPEQAQAGMEAWMSWASRAGSAILDLGSPTKTVATVGGERAEGVSSVFVGGYTLVEADSTEAVESLLEGHPHLMMGGASIEVLELLPPPGS